VTKTAILEQIIRALSAELETLTRAARDAFAAATDPDSKAENKYDTRTLEASYVARGQAQRVVEVQEALRVFQQMAGEDWPADSEVGVGALVTLQTSEGRAHYLMGTAAGGLEVTHEGAEVLIITPSSLLAQKLKGRRQGDRIALRPGWEAVIEAVR
jgi:transcription elongation GreA/GreB family factor